MSYAVIAPHYDDEYALPHLPAVAAAMAGALQCDPLVGHVSASALRQYLRDQSLSGLYLGGHAGAGDLMLSGGERMPAAEFAGILGNCMSEDTRGWVLLAACESDAFLHAIQSAALVDVAAAIVTDLPDAETRAIEMNLAEALRQSGGDLGSAIYRHKYQMLPYFRYWQHPGNLMNRSASNHESSNGRGSLYEQVAENRIAIKYQERRVDDVRVLCDQLRAELDELERNVSARGGGMAIYNHPAAQPVPYNDSQLVKFVIAVIAIGLVFATLLFVALRLGGA